MGHREDYQIPDWVVKDYNSRVPKEDKLPLYDGTDDSEYGYLPTETSLNDKSMIAFRKALRTGDYEEYNKIEMERRMLWYGAHGFTKEQILETFYKEEEPPQDIKPSKTFNYFMLFLLVSALAFIFYMIYIAC